MVGIPDSYREWLISSAVEDSNGDDRKAYSIIERGAALFMIGQLLGEAWYENQFKLGVDRPDLDAFPAAKYGRTFSCISSIKLKRLGQSLEKVAGLPGFEAKSKELTGRRFDKVVFELLIAEYFLELGCKVEFLPPSFSPTCDLRLDDEVYAECKFADDWPLDDDVLRGKFANYVAAMTIKIPQESAGVLIVCLPLDRIPTPVDRERLGLALEAVLDDQIANPSGGFERLLAARAYIESTEAFENGRKCKVQYVRILLWKSPHYNDLPRKVRFALEDSQDRVKPRIWIDYKGLSKGQ